MSRGGQGGVALVTALLVVALASIAATAMVHRLALDIRRGGNLMAMERAHQYARGMELWALDVLARDAEKSPGLDSRNEVWATALPPVEVPEGRLGGQLEDLDGRFNLNNLVISGVRQSRQIERFRRLLEVLSLDPGLADRVVDWLDADTTPEREGAEDDLYGRLSPAYRTANSAMADLSELRLIAGVDAEVFSRLAPHVAVLPVTGEPTRINVNTATLPVLTALDPVITPRIATALYQEGRADYPSISEFLSQPELAPHRLNLLPLQADTISLDSRFFAARGMIEVEGRIYYFVSRIEQVGTGAFRVTARSPEPFFAVYERARDAGGEADRVN